MSLNAVCSLRLRDVHRIQDLDEQEFLMKNTIFNAYSSVYSTAMMQNVKPANFIAVANKNKESRFGQLVKLLRRA